jgi:flagellar biosynthesis protein FlhF
LKIKRFLVHSMPQAMKQIRLELGKEAVIISSRTVRRGGVKGFFLPKMLEVTAAAEDVVDEQKTAEEGQWLLEQEQLLIKQEIGELKKLIQQKLNTAPDADAPEKCWDLLASLEINKELIDSLLQGVSFSNHEAAELDAGWFRELILPKLTTMLTTENRPALPNRIMCFVGPTGVGKTTTIAKLAAHFTFFQQKKVGLITLDTYRIGAVDQLKTYGEIIGIPVEVAMTPHDLKQVVDKFREKDIVLIDTMGYPAQNKARLHELCGFLKVIKPIDNHLVLSCTTKYQDLLKIAHDYKLLKYNYLIFTKLDETDTFGAILNLVHLTNIPVAYITNGQNVPEAIEPVTPEKLARLILGAVSL